MVRRSNRRSQWPSGLRRGSADGRLLRLRVWIPLGAWIFVLFHCKDKKAKPGQRRTDKEQKNNPGGGEIFRARSDRPWGQPSLLYNGYRSLFRRLSPPTSSAEVRERELYLCFSSGPSWSALGRTLPLPFTFQGLMWTSLLNFLSLQMEWLYRHDCVTLNWDTCVYSRPYMMIMSLWVRCFGKSYAGAKEMSPMYRPPSTSLSTL